MIRKNVKDNTRLKLIVRLTRKYYGTNEVGDAPKIGVRHDSTGIQY
jgi:hypothetical protein